MRVLAYCLVLFIGVGCSSDQELKSRRDVNQGSSDDAALVDSGRPSSGQQSEFVDFESCEELVETASECASMAGLDPAEVGFPSTFCDLAILNDAALDCYSTHLSEVNCAIEVELRSRMELAHDECGSHNSAH